MEDSESKGRLADACIKLNLGSALLAAIIYTRAGTLAALAFFLFSIHALAAAVYLLDLDSLRTGEVVENISFNNFLLRKDGKENTRLPVI
jgi:hypothetical protein